MRVIGYTSEQLAAAFCVKCAKERWHESTLTNGVHIHQSGEQYNVHPIFSTDESPDSDMTCDDCHEVIIANTSEEAYKARNS